MSQHFIGPRPDAQMDEADNLEDPEDPENQEGQEDQPTDDTDDLYETESDDEGDVVFVNAWTTSDVIVVSD